MRAQSQMPNVFSSGSSAQCAKFGEWSKYTAVSGCGTYATDVEAGGLGVPGGGLSRTSAPKKEKSSEAPSATASGPAATGALKYDSSKMEAPTAALVAPGVSLLLLRPLRTATAAVITQTCHPAVKKCHSPVLLDLLQRYT